MFTFDFTILFAVVFQILQIAHTTVLFCYFKSYIFYRIKKKKMNILFIEMKLKFRQKHKITLLFLQRI